MSLSESQKRQQRNRERDGRYAETHPCEVCGRPAGHEYGSLSTCNEDGIGVTICNRRTCPAFGRSDAYVRHMLKLRISSS